MPVDIVPAGLTSREAERLLAEIGPNRAPEPRRRGVLARAVEQLRDPMILLLLAASAVTTALRDWPDTTIILAVVVFNTTVGVVQQFRAERAMDEIRKLVAATARVRRDGCTVELPTDQLVPGDVVELLAGDIVPADAVVVGGRGLELDEAPVTGESLPVPHDAGEEVIGGTRVTRGSATALVTRTGAASGIGQIAALIAATGNRPTPLQRRLAALSRALVALVLVLTVLVVGIGLVQGRPWTEMLVVGLSLAVAAVPESLPAVVTVGLALGAHRMARRNAVVRTLSAVETLGSVTVVATDKTGTITEGRMLAQVVWVDGERLAVTGEGYDPEGAIAASDRGPRETHVELHRLLRDVVLCNDAELRHDEGAWTVIGDPLEGALLALAAKSGPRPEAWRSAWRRTAESPFDHHVRTMTTTHRDAHGHQLEVLKGAPEAVLGQLELVPATAVVTRVAAELAASGLRVLAVADRTDGEEWALAGLVGIGDPPRTTAAEVVRGLRQAGIRVVLVTGDHAGTAHAIASRVGIADPHVLPVDGVTPDTLTADRCRDLTVVARVKPDQKVDVVEALQSRGEVVAMLGDGVNDAPALRRADIGVAAGRSGTEVAKESADLVLTDDDLASVTAAVEEGRRIYANIQSFLTFAVSGGLAEVGVMLGGFTIGLTLPLLPAQILWINLFTHGFVGVAFGSEPLRPDEMSKPPRAPDEPIFPRAAVARLVAVTLSLTVMALLVGGFVSGDEHQRRTAVFLALGAGQLGIALALRARRGQGGGRRARALDLAVLAATVLLVAGLYAAPFQALLGTTSLAWDVVVKILAVAAVPGLALHAWRRMRSR
ncbi:cation-transporting P-type ATPase [Knoellia locipacati]|uniref:cation-translocating P-type ATPase n=1 Tax=Knoellia locipacati TaxID=882824 RepID=UPI00384C754C